MLKKKTSKDNNSQGLQKYYLYIYYLLAHLYNKFVCAISLVLSLTLCPISGLFFPWTSSGSIVSRNVPLLNVFLA